MNVQRNCLGTIRNIANVCCVQFSPQSSHLLAFGSSDFRTYCYDLRNLRTPWCILSGHNKAVSYAKFLDSETLVTASTDNTLKLWDLKKTTHGGLSTNACSLTFGGHTNEKNFVGLSTADGYIACGSETNEVYAYHRSLPMPITAYKFGSIDPISGKEIEEDNNLFVSSVCWRKRSNMVVSASSNGSIKVLQLYLNIQALLSRIYVRVRIKSPSNFEDTSIYRRTVQLELSMRSGVFEELLIYLLKNSMNLLVLKINNKFTLRDSWKRPSSVPTCLLSSLQTLEWREYTGTCAENELLSYLLKHALCLKTAKIITESCTMSKKMTKDLLSMPRGSTTCRLVLK
ncbi:hypothetical protein Bca4012_027149 [Brassica carinata]